MTNSVTGVVAVAVIATSAITGSSNAAPLTPPPDTNAPAATHRVETSITSAAPAAPDAGDTNAISRPATPAAAVNRADFLKQVRQRTAEVENLWLQREILSGLAVIESLYAGPLSPQTRENLAGVVAHKTIVVKGATFTEENAALVNAAMERLTKLAMPLAPPEGTGAKGRQETGRQSDMRTRSMNAPAATAATAATAVKSLSEVEASELIRRENERLDQEIAKGERALEASDAEAARRQRELEGVRETTKVAEPGVVPVQRRELGLTTVIAQTEDHLRVASAAQTAEEASRASQRVRVIPGTYRPLGGAPPSMLGEVAWNRIVTEVWALHRATTSQLSAWGIRREPAGTFMLPDGRRLSAQAWIHVQQGRPVALVDPPEQVVLVYTALELSATMLQGLGEVFYLDGRSPRPLALEDWDHLEALGSLTLEELTAAGIQTWTNSARFRPVTISYKMARLGQETLWTTEQWIRFRGSSSSKLVGDLTSEEATNLGLAADLEGVYRLGDVKLSPDTHLVVAGGHVSGLLTPPMRTFFVKTSDGWKKVPPAGSLILREGPDLVAIALRGLKGIERAQQDHARDVAAYATLRVRYGPDVRFEATTKEQFRQQLRTYLTGHGQRIEPRYVREDPVTGASILVPGPRASIEEISTQEPAEVLIDIRTGTIVGVLEYGGLAIKEMHQQLEQLQRERDEMVDLLRRASPPSAAQPQPPAAPAGTAPQPCVSTAAAAAPSPVSVATPIPPGAPAAEESEDISSKIRKLVESLRSSDAGERAAALEQFTKFPHYPDLAITAVVELLGDTAVVAKRTWLPGGGILIEERDSGILSGYGFEIKYLAVGWIAADVAAAFGEAAVPALSKAVQSGSIFQRENAARALGIIHSPGTIRLVLTLARDFADAHGFVLGHTEIKKALISIARVGDPSDIAELSKSLASASSGTLEDREFKDLVGTVLPYAGKSSADVIARSLDDDSVSWYVLQSLGEISANDSWAEAMLLTALRHRKPSVRQAAAECLAAAAASDAVSRRVPPLIALLRDKDRKVRESAALSLKRITTNDFGSSWKKWSRWWTDSAKTY